MVIFEGSSSFFKVCFINLSQILSCAFYHTLIIAAATSGQ
jgi:hypothetical protein